MRQPKFQMGDTVTVPLTFKNGDLVIIHRVQGTVCGVEYDPKYKTNGFPFYYYTVMIETKIYKNRKEKDLRREVK